MKRISLLFTLSLGLLLQSFLAIASAQENAAPPTDATAPAPDSTPKLDTNSGGAAPLIGPESSSSPAAVAAQNEQIKRQELTFAANQAVAEGIKLYKAGQLDAAADRFTYALANIQPDSSAHQKVAADLATVRVAQGDAFLKAKNYAGAVKSYQQAVDLSPANGDYRSKLASAKDKLNDFNKSAHDVVGTENNPAWTQDFRDQVAQVQKLMFEGDRLYDTGQYDAAYDRYMQIIALDPYNKAARTRLEKVDHTRSRVAGTMRDAVRRDAMAKVTADWSETVPRDYAKKGKGPEGPGTGLSRLALMNKKLEEMRIPSLSFNQADIQTVIQVLTAKSRELDTDPAKNGINFVLKTEPTSLGDAAAPAAPGGAAPAAAPAAAVAPTPINPVTLNVTNVPMIEALRFISSITNLQVKVEEYAVLLLPPNDNSDLFQTHTFAVPPGFFEGGLRAHTAAAGSTEGTNVETVKVDAKQQLIDKGVQFNGEASAAFLPGSSRLVVKNTPDQLDIIEALIRAANVETPQVDIETRLVEFTDDQLKAVTFAWNQFVNKTLSNSPYPDPLSVGAIYSGNADSGAVGTNHGGLRNASTGITPNGVDSLLQQQGTTGVNFLTGGALTNTTYNTIAIGGVIGNSSLQVVMQLIDNMKGVDLLSAPKVTAKNRTRAKIEVVQELRYPSEFERPTVNTTPFSMDNGGSTLLGTDTVYLALPATPRQFTVKPIGVTMEVTPTTYPDQRIDLELQPEVTDFEGFINYGQPIVVRSSELSPPADQEGDVDTPSIVNLPVFNNRVITTKVQVLDGQTVVLGGLIREDRQMINDKVPFFGDLPMVGRFFQSKVEQSIKRNLMIFVTAKLVKSDGRPLYNSELAVATPPTETKGR